jgi:ubiquinol-cytochrome c reductase cytochrome b subunit
MSITFMIVALINGGNDLIATHFDLSINQIMWGTRFGILILPPIAFVVTKRLCLSLQRADRELVLHGRETGRLLRLPHGEFVEVHEPISAEKAYLLTSHEQAPALELSEVDSRGVKRAGAIRNKLRSRMSVAHAEAVPKVSVEDLKEIESH